MVSVAFKWGFSYDYIIEDSRRVIGVICFDLSLS